LISGARLRRLTEDGQGFLDKELYQGALVEYDTKAKVLEVVEYKEKNLLAYLVELKVNDKNLVGWVYSIETAPVVTTMG
jgi:hypothetical protein